MKKIVLLVILFYSISFSQVYMNIQNKDGTTETYNIEDISKLTFSGLVGVEEGKLLSATLESFRLFQNYPNPFNPSTTIEYQIPESGNVEANIYGITGRLIKTIESGEKRAGIHKVNWDSKNNFNNRVSSGIYVIQVKYNNSILTKKLMLLK